MSVSDLVGYGRSFKEGSDGFIAKPLAVLTVFMVFVRVGYGGSVVVVLRVSDRPIE